MDGKNLGVAGSCVLLSLSFTFGGWHGGLPRPPRMPLGFFLYIDLSTVGTPSGLSSLFSVFPYSVPPTQFFHNFVREFS